jgi:hypothetical protein
MKCIKCWSDNISIQLVEKKEKPNGCLSFFILLIAFFINLYLGILLFILQILSSTTTKTKTKKVCVCQKCGHSWEIE